MLLGISAALGAALAWAIATRGFRKLSGYFNPVALNIWKGIISLIGISIWLLYQQPSIESLSSLDWFWLLSSGVIGIGLGDTALFLALKQLGDRATLLVAETVAPVLVLFMGWLWLADYPGAWQLLGMFLIVLGIDWVIGVPENGAHYLRSPGLKWALLAALCQALGAVLSRQVLKGSDLDPVLTAGIRLVGGMIACIVILSFLGFKLRPQTKTLKALLPTLVWVSILGTLIGLTLQQTALLHIDATLTQTLIATSALMAVGIALFEGEKISIRSIYGVMVGLIGMVLAVGAVLS